MFNMDSFRSALNMSKLTFDPNQTSVEVILSANTINAYDTKEIIARAESLGGKEKFFGATVYTRWTGHAKILEQ